MNEESAKYIGRSIATAGIWIGVGMIGMGASADHAGAAACASILAAIATTVVWIKIPPP